MLTWTKEPTNSLKAALGPFVAHVVPKADGRWDWKVFADGTENPTASGVRASAGAAKTACEQFVKRSGRV